MNKVILLGRLVRDPDIRRTRTDKSVAQMTIAVDRPGSRNAGADQQTADFIPLVAWDRTADFAGQYLVKGSQILVEGRMQTRNYEAQDGTRRYVTEVVVSTIEFAGARPRDNEGGYSRQPYGQQRNPGPQGGAPAQDRDAFGPPIPDEEIPF